MSTLNSLTAYSGLQPIVDYSTPSVNSIFTLPTGANIKAGQRVKVINGGTHSFTTPLIISVNASDATLVRSVYAQTSGEMIALQDNPTTAAHWGSLDRVTSGLFTFTPTWDDTGGNIVWLRKEGTWWREGNSAVIKISAEMASGSQTGGSHFTTVNPAGNGVVGQYPGVRVTAGGASNFTYGGSAGVNLTDGVGVFVLNAAHYRDPIARVDLNFGSGLYEIHVDTVIPIQGWTETRG